MNAPTSHGRIRRDVVDTPGGPFHFAWDDEGLRAGIFGAADQLREVLPEDLQPTPSPFAEDLRAYVDGDVDALLRVQAHQVGPDFSQRVWAALREIPAGQPVTYGELAATLNTSPRAVASACARNKIALVIPCHRVVGAKGALTGFRWGVGVKAALLEFEAASKLA